MGLAVAEFGPHAHLASDNVHSWVPRLNLIDLSPGNVGQILSSFIISKTNIEVSLVIVGEDDLIGSTDQSIKMLSLSPPLDHIVILDWQVTVLVGPVDNLFIGTKIFPHLLLFPPVHDLKVIVSRYIMLLHPFFDRRLQVPTFLIDLIPTEMNVWIIECSIDIF